MRVFTAILIGFLFSGCMPIVPEKIIRNEKILVLVDDTATDEQIDGINAALQGYEKIWDSPDSFDLQLEEYDSEEWNEESFRIIRIQIVEEIIDRDGKALGGHGTGSLYGSQKWTGSIKLANWVPNDTLAVVVAHEIGHVFWLSHAPGDPTNIMNPTVPTDPTWTTEQIAYTKAFAFSDTFHEFLFDGKAADHDF